MTIEEKLKQLILDRYKSIRAFTKEIDTPYSTIDTMLKRGVGGTSITTVLKVCNALNIDADALIENELREKQNSINISIKSSEQDILKKYNALDEHGKDIVTTILEKEYIRVMKK
ncbi:TPA: helix-turn-helix domain-containing protein [Clostridioides difficile]